MTFPLLRKFTVIVETAEKKLKFHTDTATRRGAEEEGYAHIEEGENGRVRVIEEKRYGKKVNGKTVS